MSKNTVSKKDVKNIAELARIVLNNKEIEAFQGQLSSILDYISQLQDVNTEGIGPTVQVTGIKNSWREDEVKGCDKETRDLIIEQFPDRQDDLDRVPSVF